MPRVKPTNKPGPKPRPRFEPNSKPTLKPMPMNRPKPKPKPKHKPKPKIGPKPKRLGLGLGLTLGLASKYRERSPEVREVHQNHDNSAKVTKGHQISGKGHRSSRNVAGACSLSSSGLTDLLSTVATKGVEIRASVLFNTDDCRLGAVTNKRGKDVPRNERNWANTEKKRYLKESENAYQLFVIAWLRKGISLSGNEFCKILEEHTAISSNESFPHRITESSGFSLQLTEYAFAESAFHLLKISLKAEIH
ncbi:unnamed protein product [Enterobius vermicularis]|uniref:Uncharacterized protein n=1 Tax=Enterobius vermicularis TaxID=51028 RepID=A0A0N4VD23_ENTVE|nr:unnamed protein product [Enterobius vermicularis]